MSIYGEYNAMPKSIHRLLTSPFSFVLFYFGPSSDSYPESRRGRWRLAEFSLVSQVKPFLETDS